MLPTLCPVLQPPTSSEQIDSKKTTKCQVPSWWTPSAAEDFKNPHFTAAASTISVFADTFVCDEYNYFFKVVHSQGGDPPKCWIRLQFMASAGGRPCCSMFRTKATVYNRVFFTLLMAISGCTLKEAHGQGRGERSGAWLTTSLFMHTHTVWMQILWCTINC